MNVLLVAAADSVHVVRWANAFVDRGIVVDLATQHIPLPGFSSSVRIHRLPYSGGAGYFRNRTPLRRLVQQIRPDVVNTHYASGYGTLTGGLRDAHVVLNVWGSDVYSFPEKSVLHRWWLKRNLRSARQLVSTSEAMASRVRALLGEDTAIAIVPFGVDTARFRPMRIVHEDTTIGTVKTLKPVYGIDRLVEAFCIVHRERPGTRLRIVGEGPELAALQGQSRSLALEGSVTFVGAVPHDGVADELHHLDVYVALSRSESFGVAVIEASACGLPVVVSDAGGLPEVVQHGITGFVVPGGDARLAAEHLLRLVDDAALRERVGRAGAQWVKEKYAWSHCVDLQLAVLQQVIDQR
ncbi:MAG: glycosyltransferase [Flavobacteriales bacterium]|nr:glycosyltransferase [Flavobacteriales bacterium]